MKKKEILVVGPFGATGGVCTFMRNLCLHSNLSERWHFNQFSTTRPPKTVSNNHQYTFLQSDPTRLVKSLFVTGRNVLRYPLNVQKADLLQIQSSDYYSFWESMAYAKVAKLMNKPVVVRFGGVFDQFYDSSSPRQQDVIRKALQLPDAIIVQSIRWKEYFSQFVPVERLNIVSNAVPMPPPIPDRSQRTGPVKALFICTNDAKRKGIDSVLEAVAVLKDRVDFTFVACNDVVRELVKEKGLTTNIHLFDPVSRVEMKERFYPEADIFLLPSHGEGFPNSMLEAMASGLPLVTTAVGAIPDVLTAGTHGFLNEPGDSDALIRDISYLVDHPQHRFKMGEACHSLVSTKYEINSVFARFDRLWDSLLES